MKPERYSLSNGLDVLLLENHAAEVVSLQVWVGVGSADETAGEYGLAHVHEHMIFKGTERRGVGEIAREVEASGGEINARTGFDYTVYHIDMSSRFFERGLDILSDAIFCSAFDADELERELEVIQEELKRSQDSPSWLASRALFDTAYALHPYKRPVIGFADTIDAFTREDVLSFFHKWYIPQNMTLVVAGDFESPHARELIERFFGRPSQSGFPERMRTVEPTQSNLRASIHNHDVRESHLHLAFHIPQLDHDDVPALDILSIVLGAGESSRLENEIRRNQGLVNGIGTYAYTPRDPGLLVISSTFQENEEVSTQHVVQAVLTEVYKTRILPLTQAEIERAKTLIMSQVVYQKQTMHGQAQKLGFFQLMTGSLEFEDRYYDAVANITAQDILDVAVKYLRSDNLSLALVRPEDSEELTLDDVVPWVETVEDQLNRLANRELPPADDHGVIRKALGNGMTLLLLPDPAVPLVSIWANVLGGKLSESQDNAGSSYLLSRLLTGGTPTRSATQIAQTIEGLGGSISGFAGDNSLGLQSTFLAPHLEEAIELFADCLLNARLPEDELQRERKLILEEIHAQEDNLAGAAFRKLATQLYGDHPYGQQLIGTTESVAALNRTELSTFYQDLIHPQRIVLALVGDFEPKRATELLEQAFASTPLHVSPQHKTHTLPELSPRLEVITKDRQQSHIAIGFRGTCFSTEDRYALDLVAAILAGQGGRLFRELRDKQSLAYSVTAFNRSNFVDGYFGFYIATSADKLHQALAGIASEIEKMRVETLPEHELERAKQYVVGSHDISMQRTSTRASSLALHELYGLGYDFHYGFGERILSVTVEDIQRVAQAYLDPARVQLTVLHPEGHEVTLDAFSPPEA